MLEDVLTEASFTAMQFDVLSRATGPHRPRDVAVRMARLHRRLDEVEADLRVRAALFDVDPHLPFEELCRRLKAMLQVAALGHHGDVVHAGMLPDVAGAQRFIRSDFMALLDALTDGALVADRSASYIHANPAACRMLGYSREQLLGMRVPDLAGGENWREEGYRDYLQRKRFDGVAELRRSDGRTLRLWSSGRVMEVASGIVAVCLMRPL